MIIINDIEKLKTPCSDIEEISEAQVIIKQLEKELELSEQSNRSGIGLAAPQIGIFKNVAIIRVPHQPPINLVNAIIKYGYDLATVNEACLSFPDVTITTKRYQEIYVINNLVEPHNFIATKLIAHVIQHELDHLKGRLLPEIANKNKLII